MGEENGGSGTRRGKGREEKRGGRTLGGGLLVRLLLGEEGVVGGVGIVEELAQAEHFLLRVFVLVALDARLFLVFISLLLCVGGLLLQRYDLFLKVRDLLLEVRKRRGSLRRGRRRRRRGRRGGGPR